jgi:uncharacterized protein YkuJ
MKRRLFYLFAFLGLVSFGISAQTSHNPLNSEPANVILHRGISSKKPVNMTYFRADGTVFEKSVYTYDRNGKRSAVEVTTRNTGSGSLRIDSKEEYIYSDKKMSVLKCMWNGNSWDSNSKTDYTYNDNGKKISSINYSWDNEIDTWATNPSVKKVWQYNDKGLEEQNSKYYFDNQSLLPDLPATRISYSYDDKGNQIEELIEIYNSENKAWSAEGKYTYTYNLSGKEVVCNSFIVINGQWFNDLKIVCKYDEDGDLVRGEYYSGANLDNLTVYCEYEYVNKSSLNDKQIVIGLNHKTELSYFDLTVPDDLVGSTVFIYDTSGKLMQTETVNNTGMRVDVNGLPTGVYFVKAGSVSKKIVVK